MARRIQLPLLPLVILVAAGLAGGCANIAQDVAEHLAEKSLRHQKTTCVIAGDALRYRQCLKARGGSCSGGTETPLAQTAVTGSRVTPVDPAPSAQVMAAAVEQGPGSAAQAAVATLSDPFLAKAVAVHDHLRGHSVAETAAVSVTQHGGAGETVTLDTSVDEVQGFLARVHTSVAAGAWDAHVEQTGQHLASVTASARGSAEHHKARQDHRTALFIREYLKAYFNGGDFIEVDLSVNVEQAIADLAEKLGGHRLCAEASSGGAVPTCSALAQDFVSRLQLQNVQKTLIPLGSAQFQSRDLSYSAKFPGIKIQIDPTAHHLISVTDAAGDSLRSDYLAIGIDLVHILLEAIFDSHEGLPALPSATGTFPGGLETFTPSDSFTSENFSAMTTTNNRIEAAAGILVDRLIRGIGPLSLDNAALEQAIVQILATTVRKAVEKATYCFYSCGLAQAVEAEAAKIEAEAAEAVSTVETDVRTKVEGAEESLFDGKHAGSGKKTPKTGAATAAAPTPAEAAASGSAQPGCVNLKLELG